MDTLVRGLGKKGERVAVNVDSYSGGIVCIDEEHEWIHKGYHFTLGHYFASIANETYGRIWFTTNKEIHAVFFVYSTAGVIVAVHTTPETTYNASNAITPLRSNLNESKDNGIYQACHTPTGSGDGAAITLTYPFGTGGNPAQSSPGDGRNSSEIELVSGNTYCLVAQSLADGNKVTLGVSYYVIP